MYNEDAPQELFSSSEFIKRARKQHTCYLCNGPIRVGTSYIRITSMTDEDDKPHRLKMHNGYRACRGNLPAEEQDHYDPHFAPERIAQ